MLQFGGKVRVGLRKGTLFTQSEVVFGESSDTGAKAPKQVFDDRDGGLDV